MKKKHVKLPRTYNPPGKHTPPETLAYLTEAEHDFIRRMTDGRYSIGPKGVKSYVLGGATTKGTAANAAMKSAGGITGSVGKGGSTNTGGARSSTSQAAATAAKSASPAGAKSPASNPNAKSAMASTGQSRGPAASMAAAKASSSKSAFGNVAQVAKSTAQSHAKPVGNPPSLQGRTWNNVLNTPYNNVFPERAPVTGTATSFPGRPRPNNRFHSGLDFGVAPGSIVTPVVPGKVVQVAYSPGAYGPTVQVMNTFGGIDRYALHQPQKIPVQVGQPVYPGTALGVAGKLPGRPTNFSHLHYERITPQDSAYNTVVAGMKDGSLASARGGVVGSTSTYRHMGRDNIQSSTPAWARSMGIGLGEQMQRGAPLQSAGAPVPVTPTQTATIGSYVPRPRPRPDDIGVQPQKLPRPILRPNDLFTGRITRNPFDTERAVGFPRARPPQGPIPTARPPMQGPQVPPVGAGMSFTPGLPASMTPPPSFVNDPRVGMPPGAFPAAERVLGVETYIDPNTGIARNPFDTQRGTPKVFDQRVKSIQDRVPQGTVVPGPMPPGGITPTRPASIFSDPRIGLPLGGLPASPPPIVWADNSSTVSPRHWGREEVNYLTQTGAMNIINQDPYAKIGYDKMQNPDGSGLMIGGDVGDLNIRGRYNPVSKRLNVSTEQSPEKYAETVGHELGHVGAFAVNKATTGAYYPHGVSQEEVRQRLVDTQTRNAIGKQPAEAWLGKPQMRSGMGMSFTPGLPAQPDTRKQVTSIDPTIAPPIKPPAPIPTRYKYRPADPVLPGPMPRPVPWMRGVEPHKHTSPPKPYEYRNESPPAEPNVGSPASQTAEGGAMKWINDKVDQGYQKANYVVKEAQKVGQKVQDNVDKYGEDAVVNRVRQMAGVTPDNLKQTGQVGNFGNLPMPMQSAPVMVAPVEAEMPMPSQEELTALLARMQAQGATPEEIAFVQSLIQVLA